MECPLLASFLCAITQVKEMLPITASSPPRRDNQVAKWCSSFTYRWREASLKLGPSPFKQLSTCWLLGVVGSCKGPL